MGLAAKAAALARQLARPGLAGELCALDYEEVARQVRWIGWLSRHYFRAEVRGLEHVPDDPSLLVGNHDGGYLPVDGLSLGAAWHERFRYDRPLTWLMHDFPFRISKGLTRLLSSCGARPASRANLRRALEAGQSVFVYPGGAREAFRPFTQRRHLDLGHRTGFIEEALAHRVPIVPVVSVGAHETLFVVARGAWVAERIPLMRRLRADVLPLWVGLPWLVGFGPLPHLPLPAKLTVEVLPPIRLWEHFGPPVRAAREDPRLLRAALELVRGRMQAASHRLHAARRYPVLG